MTIQQSFEYLSVDQIVAINRDQAGASLLDRGGIESIAARPRAAFAGVERFPDLWTKAAAYLHGLATTQYFADGNKRTAWLTAATFLAANGHPVPEVSAIEAETFVQAVAQEVYDSHETRPDVTLERAAEWFQSKFLTQRVGNARHPRLEYLLLAEWFEPGANGLSAFTLEGGGLSGYAVVGEDIAGPFPATFPLVVVGRYHWTPVDRLVEHVIAVEVVALDGVTQIENGRVEEPLQGEIPPSGHRGHQHTGLLPMIFHIGVEPMFSGPADCVVRVEVDGVRVAEAPFDIKFIRKDASTM